MNQTTDHREHLDSYWMPTTALELADAFLEERGEMADEEEVAMTRSAMMMAGEFLAETAGPCRWEALNVAEFYRRIDHLPHRQLEGTVLTLLGVYIWMCLRGALHVSSGLAIAEDLTNLFPGSEPIQGLWRKIRPMLIEVSHQLN